MEDKSATLSQEVESIFNDLVRYRKDANSDFKKGNKKAKFLFILSLLLIVIGIAVVLFIQPIYFENNSVVLVFGYILSLLSLVAFVVSAADDVKSAPSFLYDPTLVFFENCSVYSVFEMTLLKSFSKYSVKSLQYVCVRLRNGVLSSNSVVGLLVGSILKVGLIPGILAILLAVSKIGSSDSYIYNMLAIAIIWIYFLCFRVASITTYLERYILLINFHLKHERGIHENNNEK